jgi:hypothetical protein
MGEWEKKGQKIKDKSKRIKVEKVEGVLWEESEPTLFNQIEIK